MAEEYYDEERCGDCGYADRVGRDESCQNPCPYWEKEDVDNDS